MPIFKTSCDDTFSHRNGQRVTIVETAGNMHKVRFADGFTLDVDADELHESNRAMWVTLGIVSICVLFALSTCWSV